MTLAGAALRIVLLLFLAACASKPIYRGVTYDSFPDALKAQQAYFDQARQQLKPPGVHVDSSLRVVLPTRQHLRAHGVSGTAGEEVLSFLADAGFANINSIPDVIRRADVFREVSVEYYESPKKPTAASGEFALWLQTPDPKTVTWTLIAGPQNAEQQLLTATGLDQGPERMNIWVQELAETARRLRPSN
jgi:hypothetical protein